MQLLSLNGHRILMDGCRVAKIGTALEQDIYRKLMDAEHTIKDLTAIEPNNILYYQEACRYWVKANHGLPFFRRDGVTMQPPHGRIIAFRQDMACSFAMCIINSSLFYWFYSSFCDCEHINDKFVKNFPIPSCWENKSWIALAQELEGSLKKNATRKTINTRDAHIIEYDEMKAVYSKGVIDKIDMELAKLYGFTDEEIDFIINYDIKYRMGQDLDETNVD
jgi:hypothetical protein